MITAAAARKIAENLIALAAKATPGPWFHRQAMQTRPWPHEDEEYDWIGDAEKGQPHTKVILQRQSLYGGAPDYAYIAACVPETITALAQAFLSLSRPQAGTWEPIETFVLEDRATAIVACPSLNKPGEWIIGEAIYICDDKPVDRGLWWWANTGPGDYFASPIIETNGAPAHWQPLPAAPSLTTPPATEEDA